MSALAIPTLETERPKARVRTQRDADRTQAAILAAATREFARHGLELRYPY